MRIAPRLALAAALLAPGAINAATPTASPAERWRYADVADLYAGAPVIARLRIAEAIRVKVGAPPGIARFYVEGDVITLIRAPGPLPQRIRYLIDLTPDSRGKLPKLKKADVLIAAFAGRPGEVRLAARDAQVAWSPAIEARVRALLAEATGPAAPPVVTGVASAFHVAGTVPGESETQIFLTTAGGKPVSLSVLRRPGEAPRWSATFGELVDEGAAAPPPDTLGWYRLACFLPRLLSEAAIAELAPAEAEAARTDYAFVLDRLGACPRVRGT